MFKYILFDWDGCLVDTLPIWYQGMKRGLYDCGISASDREIKKGFQTWNFFIEMGISDLNLFTEIVYGYVMGCLDNVRFNEGVIELLEQAKSRDIKTAIVTSTERSKVLPVLSRLDATEYFNCIIGRLDVINLKPHPDPVNIAIDKIGGSREETVMVGDSLSDIQSGKSAGIKTVWYLPEYNREYHLNKREIADVSPDMIISHMNELTDLI
ncbi:MAG: HAD family hydrolase [Desulfobacteraceae bacterium]|jgi:pyrophosphatase PpaX